MGRKGGRARKMRVPLAAAARAAAAHRRVDSFQPDMSYPEMKMRNAEDASEPGVAPLTEQERADQERSCDAQRQMLTTALDPDAQRRQKLPFTGSVVDHVLAVAREAEQAGAQHMEQHVWTQWHEMMYAKHLPFSQACYKLFRRAAEGGALQDEEFVKLLVVGRMRERGRVSQEHADKLASTHVTKRHMYAALRRDVEAQRAEVGSTIQSDGEKASEISTADDQC